MYCADSDYLQIFDIENETLEIIDDEQIEGVEGRFADRLEFSKDGRLYVASADGKLLLFPESFN